MKKTNKATSLALATLLSLGSAVTSFAAIPEMTVVIGDKAYHLDYANDPANEGEIIAQIGKFTPADIFIKGPDGKWIVNETQEELADVTKIPAVVYKDKDGEKEFAQHDGEEVTDLKVVSVSAINLKELTVTFNQKVDKASAETSANYSVAGTTFTAKLQEDGKTVLLFASNALGNNSEKKIKVKNVKNEAGDKKLDDFEVAVQFADIKVPELVSAKALSGKEFQLIFSEPIKTLPVAADFKINGKATATDYGAYTVARVADSNDREITLSTANLVPPGEAEIEIKTGNADDYAGYKLQTVKKTVTVESDLTAPTPESVTVNSQTEAIVKFNKEIKEATVAAGEFQWNTKNTTVGAKTAVAVKKVDATTYKVTFAGANAMAAGEAFFFVGVAGNIEDLNGNKVAPKSFAITVPADAQPEVSSVVAISDSVVQIQYSKPMDETSVTKRTNYVLKDSTATVDTTAGTLTYDSTNNLVLWTGLTLSDTQYSLTIKGVKDSIGNEMPEVTKEFTNQPLAKPVKVEPARLLKDADGAGKDVVVLPFSLPVAVSGSYSILNIAKWKVDAAPLTNTYSNATIEINPNDNKEVRIHLNAAMVVAGADDVFKVNNFASLHSDAALQTTEQAFVDISAAQAKLDLSTDATSIKLTDKKTFELKVDRKLSDILAEDFEVKTGGSDITDTNPIAEATWENKADGAVIKIVMTEDLDVTKAYRIATKAAVTGTKDLDGLLFDTAKEYATDASVSFGGSVVQAYITNDTEIVLVVDQAVSLPVKGDFKVSYDGEEKTVSAAARVGNLIVLTVAAGANEAASITVDTKENDLQTETAGGKLLKIGDPIQATVFRVTGVSLADGNDALEANDQIIVTFNKAVDPETLGFDKTADKQSDGSYLKNVANTVELVQGNVNTLSGKIILNKVSDGTTDVLTLLVKNAATQWLNGSENLNADIELSADGKTLTYTITGNPTKAFTKANYEGVQQVDYDLDALGSVDKETINVGFKEIVTTTGF